ncbi:MAG TPA: hypothetical protein DCY91_15850 [Cyanobacteria bacterium UBA11370]|nr:hypothetical protein [Cyanobacteria bacterium UBA11370]HBY78433.1 hypothetical protein [Cyanobacteria bacterium UBA11148]
MKFWDILALNAIAYLFGILSYLVILYRYTWTGDPALADYIDPDAAGVAKFFSSWGLMWGVLAVLLFLIKLRQTQIWTRLLLSILSMGALFICSYRLVEVIGVCRVNTCLP